MFRLGNKVGGDIFGASCLVREHDHFTGAGQAIDSDLAKDVLLGQRDKDIARSDDHIDGGNFLDAISEGSHGLGAADTVDLGDA